MRQGNARISGACQGGRDARHHFVADALLLKKLQFLSATPEYKRISALEADDETSLAGMREHQLMNAGLSGVVVLAGSLADGDLRCIAPSQVQNLLIDQPVVQNDVGLVKRT